MGFSATSTERAELERVLRRALKGQYLAALEMLWGTIELYPESCWDEPAPSPPFWRLAYHTLFFAHMYLQPSEEAFTPWPRHQAPVEDLDEPLTPELLPYCKTELLAYCRECESMVGGMMDAFDLLQPVTGFSWHQPQRSKVEQHISAIRHIQHHTAQLSARLRMATGEAVGWVGAVPRDRL